MSLLSYLTDLTTIILIKLGYFYFGKIDLLLEKNTVSYGEIGDIYDKPTQIHKQFQPNGVWVQFPCVPGRGLCK